MIMKIFTSNNNNIDEDENNHHPYDFIQQENSEQLAVINRIRSENRVPVTGPPGTGKSTVISHSCFDLIKDYSPVLVVSPTNAMVNSNLAKIDYLAKQANLQLP
jgi:hypothetical protein